ncbi:MAG: hypothetical protein OEV79_04295 [candidate division WOR-3 bacterium]|nr:hypothetical protein [candidate division WOR-3 bacterium]
MRKKAKEAAGYIEQQSSIKPGAGIILGTGLDRLATSIKAASIAELKLTKIILGVVGRLRSILNHE